MKKVILAAILAAFILSSCRSYYVPDKSKGCNVKWRKEPKFKA